MHIWHCYVYILPFLTTSNQLQKCTYRPPPKNYNAENEGFLKLSTIHEKP